MMVDQLRTSVLEATMLIQSSHRMPGVFGEFCSGNSPNFCHTSRLTRLWALAE